MATNKLSSMHIKHLLISWFEYLNESSKQLTSGLHSAM